MLKCFKNSRLIWFTSAEEHFKINIFYLTLDNAIMQLKERFTSLNNVFKIFEVIQPNSLINLTDEQIYNSANKLWFWFI